MTNNTIILDEVFNRFTAEERADMIGKIRTPEQVAAFMLRIDFHSEEMTEAEKLDTAAAYLLADNLHTFAEGKRLDKSVKPGEHAVLVCYLWKYSDKPRKTAQVLKETARDDEPEEGDGYFYKTKSHLFGAWQVESAEERDKRQTVKPMTREELIAYKKSWPPNAKPRKSLCKKPPNNPHRQCKTNSPPKSWQSSPLLYSPRRSPHKTGNLILQASPPGGLADEHTKPARPTAQNAAAGASPAAVIQNGGRSWAHKAGPQKQIENRR